MTKNSQRTWKTDWDLLLALPAQTPTAQKRTLERLASQYWWPILGYIQSKGYSRVDAEDLTQDFFTQVLRSNLFNRADRRKGKFRSYLLGAVSKFLAKQYRNQSVATRKPPTPLLSLDAKMNDAPLDVEVSESPEQTYHRYWIVDLLNRAIEDCRSWHKFSSKSENVKYWGAFEDRILQPLLTGEDPMPLQTIALKYDLPHAHLSNIFVTVKRRLSQTIVASVKRYSSTDAEAVAEIRDLIRLLD